MKLLFLLLDFILPNVILNTKRYCNFHYNTYYKHTEKHKKELFETKQRVLDIKKKILKN
jgi:hypothetical protein